MSKVTSINFTGAGVIATRSGDAVTVTIPGGGGGGGDFTTLGVVPTGLALDGITDDGPAIQACFDAGNNCVIIPEGTSLVNTTVTIPIFGKLRGVDENLSWLKTTGLGKILNAGGDYCSIEYLGLLGTFDSIGINASQIGINTSGYNWTNINRCKFKYLAGFGVSSDNNQFTSISECSALNNNYCVLFNTLSEYSSITNCNFSGAGIGGAGIIVTGGNSRIENNHLYSLSKAIYLTSGTNNAHGIATGNTINHCTYSIYAEGVTYGYEFADNDLFYSNIKILTSDGIRIRGGVVQDVTVTHTDSTNTQFLNVREFNAITWVVSGTAPDIISVTNSSILSFSNSTKALRVPNSIESTITTKADGMIWWDTASSSWKIRALGATEEMAYKSYVLGAKTFLDFQTLNADPTQPLHAVTKQYADGLQSSLFSDRGNYNASSNLFPSTGGTGSGGAVLTGNLWDISVSGTLGGTSVTGGNGTTVRSLTDSPGQTASNWAISPGSLAYTPLSDTLNSGRLFVGSSGNVATGVDVTGVIAISNTGVTSFPSAVSPAKGGTGVTNNAASTLAISGNFATTLTVTNTTAVTLPTSGTLATTAQITGTNSGTNTGDQDLSGLAVKSNNLSDLTNAGTARTNLGLGTLATQSGTFSGTSSGANTGDQTNITGNAGTVTNGVYTTSTNVVTNAMRSQMAANTIKGNNTAGTANEADLTAAQVLTILNISVPDYQLSQSLM